MSETSMQQNSNSLLRGKDSHIVQYSCSPGEANEGHFEVVRIQRGQFYILCDKNILESILGNNN